MRDTRRLHFRILFVLTCVSVCLVLISCSPQSPQEAFFSRLQKIDDAILSGETIRARKSLLSMRKQASSATQWLSLVKRERLLDLYPQAVQTLKEALVQLPANESLAAVLTDTLVALDRRDEAVSYAKPLLSTPFAPIAASIGMQLLAEQGLESHIDPRFCVAAYTATANAQFIVYAAMLYAKKGDFVSACDLVLRTIPGQYRHFTALLCYDAALYDRVFSLYGDRFDGVGYTSAELLLLADSYIHSGDTLSAREIWAFIDTKFPRYSPLPSFNLTRTDLLDESNASLLIGCLERFPSYFPAIALYSHRSRHTLPVIDDDPITQKLREEGFISTGMMASLEHKEYSQKEALALISRAIADPVVLADPRYHIERIRLYDGIEGARERKDSMVWNLLEEFPLSAASYDFALWFFIRSGAYDTAFSLNAVHPNGPIPLYSGLEAAFKGQSDTASSFFMQMADDERLAWIGLANAALIHSQQGEKITAIEELTTAAALAPDIATESEIQYRIAVILESMRSIERAESVLGYALELNPQNHLARSLLGRIRAAK